MIKNYEKLLKIINKNIIKLTKQLSFLNEINDNILIQYGGSGLESQMIKIDEAVRSSFSELERNINDLKEKITNYEKAKEKRILSKKENLFQKLENLETVEETRSMIDVRDKNYKLIKETINRLDQEGHDIMKPDFKKILIEELKKLSVSSFKYLGKENIIIEQFYFINLMFRKFIFDKMQKEEMEKYQFMFNKKTKIVAELLNERRDLKKLLGISVNKFKDTILKALDVPMTPEEEKIRNKLIIDTKEAIRSFYSEKPTTSQRIIEIMDKDIKELVQSDILEMELLSNL